MLVEVGLNFTSLTKSQKLVFWMVMYVFIVHKWLYTKNLLAQPCHHTHIFYTWQDSNHYCIWIILHMILQFSSKNTRSINSKKIHCPQKNFISLWLQYIIVGFEHIIMLIYILSVLLNHKKGNQCHEVLSLWKQVFHSLDTF